MYRGIFLLSLRGCVYAVVFVLLDLCCWICAVVFVLLYLCCWVFALLGLCCWVCAVGFTLLCPEFCPPSTHAVVFSIVAFLFMLVPMLWSVFGHFHFLKLPYVQYLPYTLSLVSWFPLILDIFPAFFFLMSIFLIIASWISSAVAYFWTYSLLEAPLCPISPINSITCFLISLDFGYISCFLLLYVHFSHHSFLNFLCRGLFWIFSLLEAPLCPISPIDSITCFLISLDFGYISCFLLLYVHFSHHSFLDFPQHGLFLDIFTSWSSIMSNFSHRLYHLFPDFPWFWIYFLLFASLYPFFSS